MKILGLNWRFEIEMALCSTALFVLLASSPAVGSDPFDEGLARDPIHNVQFETSAKGVFHGVGVVKEIQVSTGALTLDHEAIKGLMPAMTMMYRVQSPSVSKGLKVGDRVAFEVDAKTYTIRSAKLISSTAR